MCLKANTKQALENYINETLGHFIHNSNATDYQQFWEIECKECNNVDFHRIDNLLQLKRTNKDIVCGACKEQVKINKFCEKQEFTITDYEGEADANKLLTCNHCELPYLYKGDDFRCYCKMNIKQCERTVYEYIHEHIPEAYMLREVGIYDKHKADIVVFHEGKEFYIEVDDTNHFYRTTVRGQLDIEATTEFADNFDDNCYLIRIPNDMISNNYFTLHLLNLIENIVTGNEQYESVILFRTNRKNYYNYLGDDFDFDEIIHNIE